MTLNISLLMEPVAEAHTVTNLALHMAWEAQQRGYTVYHHTIDSLTYRDGRLFASARPLTLEEGFERYDLGAPQSICLNEMDVALFMIETMPFEMPFLTITYLFDRLCNDTLVVNNPREIREAANKILMLAFDDLAPETIITSSLEDIEAFRESVGDIIIKPIYGTHGAEVYRINSEDENLGLMLEQLTKSYPGPLIAQRFVPDIVKGDKRLYLVDGEYVGGFNRVPPKGEYKATTYTGGRTEPTTLTDRDREICTLVGREMKKRGIIFAGLDVIGGYLTEVNTSCPGGVGYINRYCKTNVQARGWDVIESRLATFYSKKKGAG